MVAILFGPVFKMPFLSDGINIIKQKLEEQIVFRIFYFIHTVSINAVKMVCKIYETAKTRLRCSGRILPPPPHAFMCGWWFSMLKKADSVIYIGSVPVWYLHLGDITHSDPLATQPAVTAHLHTRVNAYRGVQHCRLL